MTFSSDKPKRKNSPNRRRKFLLMIVLPVVALIVGVMALSPQIDAWLATDPFTPQCHFEEDRLFATGHPLRLTSINEGQYDPIYNFGSNSINWSPDSKIITYGFYNDETNEFEAMLISATGEILYKLEGSVTGTAWSPNNRYVTYLAQSGGYFHVLNMDTEQEVSDVVPEEFAVVNWSPDSRYIVLLSSDDNDVDKWLVKDIEKPNDDSHLWEVEMFRSRHMGWSANSQYAYFGGGNKLYRYDVTTDNISEFLELPHVIGSTTIEQSRYVISPDHSKIVFWKEGEFTFIVDLDSLEIVELDSFQAPELIRWHPDNHQLIIGYDTTKIAEPEKLEAYTYDIESSVLRPLDTKSGDLMELSPTGRYLSYVGSWGSTFIKTHRVYDLESDVDTLIAELDELEWSQIQWLHHSEKDYLVIQQLFAPGRIFTYIIDPENNSKCRIGWTTQVLEFQP